MLFNQALNDYIKNYPIYGSICFSKNKRTERENLHPLYILTQYIIDSFNKSGSNRVVVVLPDNDCNIIPLVLTKYFANMQFEKDYAGSVLDDIQPGQHLRLGKAVVEFLGIDEKNQIKFRVERKNPMEITCPIKDIHYLFEKTDGAISSSKMWNAALKDAEQRLSESKNILDELKTKRTALRKTILLLSAKNDFKDFTESLYINNTACEEVITYGEINLDNDEKFDLYNRGRLDCIPSISVTSKIEEMYYLLKDVNTREKIYSIYSVLDKFDEIISNPDTFKKILKYNIPFVVFVSENDFEGVPMLADYGFDVWHWKPSTLQSDVFMPEEEKAKKCRNMTDGLFHGLSAKVNRAATSEFILKIAKDPILRKGVRSINRLSKETADKDSVVRQLIRKIWNFQNKLTWLACRMEGNIYENLQAEYNEIAKIWHTQKIFYTGQQTAVLFDEILEGFAAFLRQPSPQKLNVLSSFIADIASSGKSITIIIPDKYAYANQTYDSICTMKGSCHVNIKRLSDFYNEQDKSFLRTDYLVALWFDKDEYLKIKQTYCYNNLVYTLYDYENRWRESFIDKFDECIPHEKLKSAAQKLQISDSDILDKPFDKTDTKIDAEFEEIADYTILNKIIRATLTNQNTNADFEDYIECVPVLLSEDKIAYFYSTHDIIDVTLLAAGHMDRPVKKDAARLKKGDKILLRQSDKDIIKERADLLMQQQGESSLRESSELWVEILNLYANGKTVKEVCAALNQAGGECSFQQVMYWLLGATIMPRDINILRVIGKVASQESGLKGKSQEYMALIDKIFEEGKKVQSYHQQAGRWLTSELKNKAVEIKAIANKVPSRGVIEEIGDIAIYTVEDVLDKERVCRNRINRIEELY